MKTVYKIILTSALLISIPHNTTAFSFKGTVSNIKDTFSSAFSKIGWKKQEEDTVQISKKVPPHVSVIVANLKGKVHIKTWDRNEVLVEAYKKGPEGSLETTEVLASLKGDTFTVKTILTEESKLAQKCNVRYDIIIPKSAHVKSVKTEHGNITMEGINNAIVARSQHGNISLVNISGGAKVHTKHGNITIQAHHVDPKQTILAASERGNINLKLPKTMNAANVVATTKKGRVTSDFEITSTRTMKLNRKSLAHMSKSLSGTIGQGGTNIKLQTKKGNVKLLTS